MKNIVLGLVLPFALFLTGFGLYKLVPAPVPPQRELPGLDDKPALLAFVPEAEVSQVFELRQHSETLDIRANGTVVPYRELNIAAEAAGRIVEKNPNVRSGNAVRKGDLLFRIDPRDYELEVKRLNGLLDQEKAALNELQQDIENAKDLLAVAQEQFDLTDNEVKRLEKLNRNVASLSELDTSRQTRLTSMNTVVTQKNQIRTLETRRSRLKIVAELAKTQLEQAELNLSRCEVLAPASGRVVMDQVEVDSFVQRGTALLSIEDTEKVEITCNLRMDQLFWILDQPEMSTDELLNVAQVSRYELPPSPVDVDFIVTGRDSEIYRWRGVLDRFEGAGLDPQSRTVPIRILVDRPAEFDVVSSRATASRLLGNSTDRRGPPMLVRGMFVDLNIKTKPTTPLLLVPKRSIKPASPTNLVWKFREDENAILDTPTAKLAQVAAERANEEGAEGKQKTKSDVVQEDKESTADEALDPSEWNIGYLQVVDGVRMIAEFSGQLPEEIGGDYWVCEVTSELSAGDLVITTPMPGIKADGTDPVRFKKIAEASELTTREESENGAVRPVAKVEQSQGPREASSADVASEIDANSFKSETVLELESNTDTE